MPYITCDQGQTNSRKQTLHYAGTFFKANERPRSWVLGWALLSAQTSFPLTQRLHQIVWHIAAQPLPVVVPSRRYHLSSHAPPSPELVSLNVNFVIWWISSRDSGLAFGLLKLSNHSKMHIANSGRVSYFHRILLPPSLPVRLSDHWNLKLCEYGTA